MKFLLYVLCQSDESLISALLQWFLHKLTYFKSYLHTKFFWKRSYYLSTLRVIPSICFLHISKNKMRLIQFFFISGQRLFNTFISSKVRAYLRDNFRLLPIHTGCSKITDLFLVSEIRLLSIFTGYSKSRICF